MVVCGLACKPTRRFLSVPELEDEKKFLVILEEPGGKEIKTFTRAAVIAAFFDFSQETLTVAGDGQIECDIHGASKEFMSSLISVLKDTESKRKRRASARMTVARKSVRRTSVMSDEAEGVEGELPY